MTDTPRTDAEVGIDVMAKYVPADFARQLERELAAYQRAAPLCGEHKPSGGTRSGCLVCGLIKLSAALSRIDYLCGEPNDMQCSGYDLHCNEDVVVENATRELAAARGKAIEEAAKVCDEFAATSAKTSRSLPNATDRLRMDDKRSTAEQCAAAIRALPSSGAAGAQEEATAEVFSAELLRRATLTPRQELLAHAGMCPRCRTQTLGERVARTAGIQFRQCVKCKTVVALEIVDDPPPA